MLFSNHSANRGLIDDDISDMCAKNTHNIKKLNLCTDLSMQPKATSLI
jgi:hypothetical protein